MHIVDELILERSLKLQARPVLWRLVKPILYRLLRYGAARDMANMIKNSSGFEAFSQVSNQLNLNISHENLAQVPAKGRAVVISNHPTGLADGIAMFDALRERRPDLAFLANADALRVAPDSSDIIIPVEWVLEKRSRERTRATLQGFKQAMQEERCVILFPSGALAKLGLQGLVDAPWASSAAALARKHNAPIVPVNLNGINSIMYYLFCILNTELRDVTLFHELLNKEKKSFHLRFGKIIAPNTLPKNAEQATNIIRQIVTQQLAQTE
ncbi:hypothetical protein MNBD_ALPHA06-2164 [hydrothermal vent metagenome]|uniref:Phospholipid/glycerol acyltransferase domain-containing protein n=1 Tax=hydrothermal vent metagenome TaxID=652676 RepID=A0A3B0R557_9ZZZZ